MRTISWLMLHNVNQFNRETEKMPLLDFNFNNVYTVQIGKWTVLH